MTAAPAGRLRRAGEVLAVFLGLGLTSFGGPVAHLGYFRRALVVRRGWLDERSYGDLVALCQFLPGPASSQVAMAIGLRRAGVLGLLAAWLGFTLPSAVAMVGFGYGLGFLGGTADAGWVLGLKAAAVAVVADAVLGMARTFAPDARRGALAVAATVAVLLAPVPWMPVVVLAVAGLAGLAWLRPDAVESGGDPVVAGSRRAGGVLLAAFVTLLVGLPLLAVATGHPALRLADGFYRAGSLVFGGGHVVLPLLDAETVQRGLVGQDTFLAGYGAAQALPGPLFSFAAFLGFVATAPPNGVPGALIALVAVFLPGALLVAGVLPFWERLRHSPRARRALAGTNAAVVGILAAALYTPVFTAGVRGPGSLAIAVIAFVALLTRRVPVWAVVLGSGAAGALL